MNDVEEILKELLDDVLPVLHAGEATSAATLQLLKDKGIVSDDDLAPYLEQAANASSVKQRAARLRFEHLFASAIKGLQQTALETAKQAWKGEQKQGEPSGNNKDKAQDQAEALAEAGPQDDGTHDKEERNQSADKREHALVAEDRSKEASSSEQPASEREPEKTSAGATKAA